MHIGMTVGWRSALRHGLVGYLTRIQTKQDLRPVNRVFGRVLSLVTVCEAFGEAHERAWGCRAGHALAETIPRSTTRRFVWRPASDD